MLEFFSGEGPWVYFQALTQTRRECAMKKVLTVWIAAVLIILLLGVGPPGAASEIPAGEQAFLTNCAVCHRDGGNIINPAKTLHRNILKANGITKPADIIAKMRNPGPGMTTFDKKTVPDKTARAIAEYILKTFK
jgi:cytochrome c6